MVIVTECERFRALDLVSELMACPVIVDLRNFYRPEDTRPMPATISLHLEVRAAAVMALSAGGVAKPG